MAPGYKKGEGLKEQKETCHEYGKLIIGKYKLIRSFVITPKILIVVIDVK